MMDYIRVIFSLIFAISVMYMLLDCEIRHKKNRYLLGLYATAVLICDGFVLLNFGYSHFMRLYPLIVHLPVFLAFVFISKFKPIKVFFVLWTLVALTTSFSLVGLIISYFFGSSMEIVNIVVYILYLPTGFMIYKHIRPSFLYMMRNTDKGWLGFSMIPISYSVLIYSIGTYDLDKVVTIFNVETAVLLFILVFSAYFLILRFFKQTREQLTLQNEQNLLMTQVAAAQLHFEALEESQEKTMLYRHDMRHHLNMINSYLVDNNKEAAQNYITEVERSIECAVVEKYCSNYTVNLILSSYITNAKNELITVETQINLPENNEVSDMDLCVIFANAIENAINACKNIPNPKDRALKIVCKTKNNKSFIQITNSYEDKVEFVDDMPVSTEENHGLGTKSIAAVAQKYGGVYAFTAQDGLFQTCIIL
ncbi:sensor histidine kinase [Desulfosporosinus lacus]|uniref:GHKL domain-containing protein n=1 Tax=Desulfosporosinus lacus DSM 15449 TaxID=1121420 RepID=A0A1M5X9W1_9FIRM|nr:sensor histidine kinase [Desulfosporosinus lacus]SHH96635.1 GHKL domain-containing protein [Desulfosporosinus lacus DSM 15449]